MLGFVREANGTSACITLRRCYMRAICIAPMRSSQETLTWLLSLKHYNLEAVKYTTCFFIRGEASAMGCLNVRDDVHVATALRSASLLWNSTVDRLGSREVLLCLM
jgi:hypothetical protein